MRYPHAAHSISFHSQFQLAGGWELFSSPDARYAKASMLLPIRVMIGRALELAKDA